GIWRSRRILIKNILLRSRFDDHLSRKFFHFFSGTMIALLFAFVFSRLQSIALILFFSIALIVLDLLRLRFPRVNSFVLSIYGPLMRKEEERAPSAQLFYMLGVSWAVI